MYVVSFGDPFNGLSLHGPFESVFDAVEWAEDNQPEDSIYQVVKVCEAMTTKS